MKRQEETLQLEFLTAERQPAKRKSSNQVLGQSASEPKRRSNLRNEECQNVVCQRIKKDNENLLNENNTLKEIIQQNQKEISDLKEELNTSNVSDLSLRMSQARIKGSQRQILDGSQNKLFNVQKDGAVTRYGVPMMILGLTMLVSLNTPANVIPSMLLLAYSSAGFTAPNLPKYNYFRRLRFMLVSLNEIYIRQFLAEAIELTIAFDETSLSTKLGHAMAITFMDQTGRSKVVSILEHEERSGSAGSKAALDVELILKALKSVAGSVENYKSICLKIKSVLTDNCRSANLSNKSLCRKLDNVAPLLNPRKSLKCTVHLCALLDKHSLKKLKLIEPFIRKVAAHFAKPSGMAKDNLYQLWQVKSNLRFLYATGERFFFLGNNALVAVLEFEKLHQIVEENQGASNGAKEIYQLMKNSSLKEELTIMAGLACLIRQLWTHLTIKSTRRVLSSKIDLLNELIVKLKSNEASIIDSIKNANVDDANVQKGRDLFLSIYETDENMIQRITSIYIDIVEQMQPFLEPFSEIEEGTEEHLIDPTNISCERVFGLMKYAEKHLTNLQFGLLANHAIAKFNRLDLALESFDSNRLEEIHAGIPKIEAQLKDQQRDQAAYKVAAARRNRDQVTIIIPRYSLAFYLREICKNNDLTSRQDIFNKIESCSQNQICRTRMQKDMNLTKL